MIGKRLGDYEILKEIGQGGQGDIYLAKNVHLSDVLVVLKILRSKGQKERFLREATTLAKLEHINICQMKHFFAHDDTLVLVVQYVLGSTLKDLILDYKVGDLREVQRIFVQVLDALIYAHSHGVAHRDIKPSNIMIDKSGIVKVIDFGIARDIGDPRLTMTGTATGTPAYMAPEQFTDDKTTDFTGCDIYSTGVSLYEACCGVLPFAGNNYQLKEKHCKENPRAPSKHNSRISRALEKVILTAMRKHPSKRYGSAEAMKHALLQASIDVATETEVVVSGRRHASTAILAVTATVILAMALFAYNYRSQIESLLHSDPKLRMASQSIAEGAAFSTIWLDSLVARDSSLAGAGWTFHGLKDLKVDTGGGVLRVSQPHQDWYGSETITFVVSKKNGERDSVSVDFTVLNVNDPPGVTGAIGQTITEGEGFAPIRLSDLVDDIDDPDSSIGWTWIPTEYLIIKRDVSGNLILTSAEGWSGAETVMLIASDRSGASDTLVGDFEVRPQPRSPEPEMTAASTEDLKVSPAQHDARLRVQPKGSVIRDRRGNRYKDVLSLPLANGAHKFNVYNINYPIHEVSVEVNSQAVDTTVYLNEIYTGSERVTLAVAVWQAGEVISRQVILNRIKTGKLSTDGLFDLPAGKYEISVDLEGLQLDSLLVDRRALSVNIKSIILKPEARNVVAFYVSVKD